MCRLPRLLRAHSIHALAALLVAAVPGALLLCVLHCTLPTHPHHHHAFALFVCDHSLASELPPPVSAAVVLALVQMAGLAVAPLAVGWLVLRRAVTFGAVVRARLGEALPVPPPRSA